MKVRCICGNLMDDETPHTCSTYSTYTNEDYYRLLESEPKDIEDLIDNMPSSDPFWRCNQCGRICFFRRGKIQIYKIEQEIID